MVNANKLKVEISLVDGDFQWMGYLTEEHLRELCAIADALNTLENEEEPCKRCGETGWHDCNPRGISA